MKKINLLFILFAFYACELELERANPIDNLELTTGSTQEIRTFSCEVQGTITTNEFNGVDNYGHCWSLQNNPTINDASTSFGAYKGKKSFISNLNNLAVNTSYYVRAYAKVNDTILYAKNISIETEWAGDVPLVQTGGVNFITTSSATIQGEIVEQGMSSVTKYGLCWSTNTNPNINNNTVEQSGGGNITDFSEDITNLTANTAYYYKAYAENNQGLSYGPEKSFSTTSGEPSVLTGSFSNLTTTTVTLEGEIIVEGDAAITEYGHCWSTSSDPNINNSSISIGNNGSAGTIINSELTSLNIGTTYYYKAYATNWFGTAYGEQNTFTTSDGSPIVKTIGAQFDSFSGWTGGCDYTFTGEIMSYGSAPITEHGVAFSQSNTEPTWGTWTSLVVQDGIYTVTYDDIDRNQIYYYRAYAENAIGTSYGETYSFRSPESCYISNTSTSGAPNITTSLNSSNTEVTVTIIGWGNEYVDNVYFYRNNTFLENMGDNVLFTNGQKIFTLPPNLEVSDCYTIQISDGGSGSILMVSDPFTIE
ncbi:hypothetical protein N9D80_02240 [Flavobacteriales bacterium]|nr:hypothetical protein [Flavobacteriales bacterium]